MALNVATVPVAVCNVPVAVPFATVPLAIPPPLLVSENVEPSRRPTNTRGVLLPSEGTTSPAASPSTEISAPRRPPQGCRAKFDHRPYRCRKRESLPCGSIRALRIHRLLRLNL